MKTIAQQTAKPDAGKQCSASRLVWWRRELAVALAIWEKSCPAKSGAAILHKIRSLGNAAAHEVKPHSNKQLALAMDIIEHLLKDVYILPKQVETEFE